MEKIFEMESGNVSDLSRQVDKLLEVELSGLDRASLSQLMEETEAVYEALESEEPDTDEESEEYGEWLNLLEELESRLEDIEDALEE